MSERPDAADLLEEARRSVLETLLPLLPQDRRYDGLMVANALAIAAREVRSGDDRLRRDLRALATLSGAPIGANEPRSEPGPKLQELERQLTQAIRHGVYDAPGARRDAVRAYLRASTERRVRISNPKALAGP